MSLLLEKEPPLEACLYCTGQYALSRAADRTKFLRLIAKIFFFYFLSLIPIQSKSV